MKKVAVGVALLLVFGSTQALLRDFTPGGNAMVAEPQRYIGLSIDPRIIQRLLGVRLLVADLIWVDTLIKSDATRVKEPFSDFYQAFKMIVSLDPDNLYAYNVAGLYLSVVKDDIRGATAILRDGVRHLEASPVALRWAWSIPFYLGYNLMFEEHDFDEGAKWIRRAGEMPGAPEYVRALASRAGTEQGRLEIASRILTDFYRRLTDPEQKKQTEQKMLGIASKQELLELNEKFDNFLSSTGAYAFSKKKQFDLFMRSVGRSKRDLMGRSLGINALGKIATE